MAIDIFLKIPEIPGETIDEQHPGEIEVFSWSWGMSQSGPAVGAGGGAPKVSISDMNLMHAFDKASPVLMTYCATGKHLKEATLTLRKAGERPQDYLIIKMNDVLISSVQDSGSNETPSESISLQFTKVDVSYAPQKPDGTPDVAVHFKYDLKLNKQA